MANLTKYSLASQVDPRVYSVFEKKLEGCDKEKVDKIISRVDTLAKEGKSLQRAMADVLYEFRLA